MRPASASGGGASPTADDAGSPGAAPPVLLAAPLYRRGRCLAAGVAFGHALVAGLVLGAIGMSALYFRTELLDCDVATARPDHAIGKLEVRRVAAAEIVDCVVNA